MYMHICVYAYTHTCITHIWYICIPGFGGILCCCVIGPCQFIHLLSSLETMLPGLDIALAENQEKDTASEMRFTYSYFSLELLLLSVIAYNPPTPVWKSRYILHRIVVGEASFYTSAPIAPSPWEDS